MIKSIIRIFIFLIFISNYSHAEITYNTISDDTLIIHVKTYDYNSRTKRIHKGFTWREVINRIIKESKKAHFKKVLVKLYFYHCSDNLYPNPNIFTRMFRSEKMKARILECENINNLLKDELKYFTETLQQHREYHLRSETLRYAFNDNEDQIELLADLKNNLEKQIYYLERFLESFNELKSGIKDIDNLDDLKLQLESFSNYLNELKESSTNETVIPHFKKTEKMISDFFEDIYDRETSVAHFKELLESLIQDMMDRLKQTLLNQRIEIDRVNTEIKKVYKRQDTIRNARKELNSRYNRYFEAFSRDFNRRFKNSMPPIIFDYSISYEYPYYGPPSYSPPDHLHCIPVLGDRCIIP